MSRGWTRIQRPKAQEARRLAARINRHLDFKRRRTTFEDLPNELLEVIFQHACTDGGKTACALAQVSFRINAVSRAARFHSVSLTIGSPANVRRAHASLLKEREAARAAGTPVPYVRHLCFSFIAIPDSRHMDVPRPHRSPVSFIIYDDDCSCLRCAAAEHYNKLYNHLWRIGGKKACDKHSRELAAEYYAVAEAFLTAVAPDIETLLLFGDYPRLSRGSLWRPLFRTARVTVGDGGFPRLRELSFAGDQVSFERRKTSGRAYPPLFPVLERLHVVAATETRFRLAEWVAEAPTLRDVRATLDLNVARAASPPFIHDLGWISGNICHPLLQLVNLIHFLRPPR